VATANKRKRLNPALVGLYGWQRNISFLYKATDEAALRLFKPCMPFEQK